jgi:hypothetical protein
MCVATPELGFCVVPSEKGILNTLAGLLCFNMVVERTETQEVWSPHSPWELCGGECFYSGKSIGRGIRQTQSLRRIA